MSARGKLLEADAEVATLTSRIEEATCPSPLTATQPLTPHSHGFDSLRLYCLGLRPALLGLSTRLSPVAETAIWKLRISTTSSSYKHLTVLILSASPSPQAPRRKGGKTLPLHIKRKCEAKDSLMAPLHFKELSRPATFARQRGALFLSSCC